jgi:hypothetical protein
MTHRAIPFTGSLTSRPAAEIPVICSHRFAYHDAPNVFSCRPGSAAVAAREKLKRAVGCLTFV